MEALKIESTLKTPAVLFDHDTGICTLKGMSCAEYAREFYNPVIQWIEDYAKNPKPETVVNIQFKYFNTSSAKCILGLLQKFNEIRTSGNQVIINWYHEKDDEQMIQDGENYSEILNFPFQLKEFA